METIRKGERKGEVVWNGVKGRRWGRVSGRGEALEEERWCREKSVKGEGRKEIEREF